MMRWIYSLQQMNIIFNSMLDKDTIGIATANIITPVSVGLAVMNPVTILTILSITSSIILNAVLIYKNLKKKNYQETTNVIKG